MSEDLQKGYVWWFCFGFLVDCFVCVFGVFFGWLILVCFVFLVDFSVLFLFWRGLVFLFVVGWFCFVFVDHCGVSVVSIITRQVTMQGGGSGLSPPDPHRCCCCSEEESLSKKKPRLFCDICGCFDLHDTEDCPTQAQMLEEPPHSAHHGSRREERPYCDTCEMFGHWTADCNDDETF